MKSLHQLDLFSSTSLNSTYEIKRNLRLVMNNSPLSRDEIVDKMNVVARAEGMRKSVSKAILDSWTKDSDPDRLPSPPWMTIFCYVMNTTTPIDAMTMPLGARVIGQDGARLYVWAKAEREKRRAVKKARLALEMIE